MDNVKMNILLMQTFRLAFATISFLAIISTAPISVYAYDSDSEGSLVVSEQKLSVVRERPFARAIFGSSSDGEVEEGDILDGMFVVEEGDDGVDEHFMRGPLGVNRDDNVEDAMNLVEENSENDEDDNDYNDQRHVLREGC
jgi:hypothetical protein